MEDFDSTLMPAFPPVAQIAVILQAPPEFLETVPLAVYACDRDGRILWFNSRAVELWGRTPRIGDDAEKYCGSYRLFLGGRQIRGEETPMAGVLRTGIPIKGVEVKIERPDGSTVWAAAHIDPVKDVHGNILGATNCLHETTALHQTADELDDFFENAAVGLHLVAGDGTILRANRAELAMLGYKAEEYVGRNIVDFHEVRERIDEILSCLGRGEQLIYYPASLRAKDGSVREVRITSNARIRDGKIINTRCMTIDVTERLRAQALVEQHHQRLTATYEHASIGIAEVDATGKFLRVNSHLSGLLGYASGALAGRSIFDPRIAEDPAFDREQLLRQVNGEIDRYTLEQLLRAADGSKVWVEITSSSVRDAEGRFLYAVRVQHAINARKMAEEALARRAAELTAFYQLTETLQHAPDLGSIYSRAFDAIAGTFRCDRAGILLFDSPGVMRFAASRGLSETYKSAVEGHSPWQSSVANPRPISIGDIEAADLSASLKDVIQREGIAALAFIPITADGRLIGKFMTYYDRPHLFTKSEEDLAVTIARHVGLAIQRSRAEAARQRSERAAQQLVAIVESSEDAIISKDLSGIIVTWNQGAERLFGYKPEEIIGKSVTTLMPPERVDEEPGILARIRRGERLDHYETVRRRKDGSLIDISLTVSPVRDGNGAIAGASKIARDITERKAMDARLRDSERQLKELLSAIPAAIYTTDAEGKITYFNEAAAAIAGRIPKIGSDEWCVSWKLYRPDGTPLPHDEYPMAVALKEGRTIRNAEVIAERPDGTRTPFIPYPTPLRDAEGRITGAINMLADVSERKQAETQQRVLFDELNHRVKNNMQMLQALLELAQNRSESSEARRVLGDASRRVAAMAAAQQVLYATAGATHFSAHEFINAVCRSARYMVPGDVNILCDAEEAELSNDVAMPLALILNELLTNAVKHGGNGKTPRTVRVALFRQDQSFHLNVEDDGPGFDLSAVRQRSSGLQLVQGLTRQLRGKFQVTRDRLTRCSVYFS
jgi:PAS domain S-box-containing protein